MENIPSTESTQIKSDIDSLNKRKEKIKNWLKNYHNLILAVILIIAIGLRIYYFDLTKSQPLWWDESDYLAYAKNLAGYPIPWTITSQHASIYPYLVSFFFMLGLGEIIAKFFLQLLPSVLTVFLAYFICKEMYDDKRIGLIAAALMATFWLHLFNTARFHIDILALFTGLLSVFIFWQGYENKKKIFGKIDTKWTIPITVLLVILTYSIRRGYFLFGIFFLIYLLATKEFKSLIKDKYNWISLIITLALIFLVEKTIFSSAGIAGVGGTYFHEEYPITFKALNVFKEFFLDNLNIWTKLLFYSFWIGLFILIFNTALSLGYLKKMQKSNIKSDLFNIITIIITLAFFILVLRTPDAGGIGESRWYFPLLLSSFIAISRTALIISDYLRPYNKYIPIFIILLIIVPSGYYQYKQADAIIKDRINSFEGIRQASLYLKEISNQEDVIISVSIPQVMYYAERNVVQPDKIASWTGAGEQLPFDNFINGLKNFTNGKYLLVSFSQTGTPDWMARAYGNNGQIAGWEIKFMDTKIDFSTGQQDIKKEKTYDDITFFLIDIKQDVFIYEIKRT